MADASLIILRYRRIGRPRATSPGDSHSRCLSIGSSSCSRPHWDHHGLRSDLRHIGTAIEAGVVLVVPQLLTRSVPGNLCISSVAPILSSSSDFSPNAIVTGTLPPARDKYDLE
jgi:hypothetical protein